jgi:hypothetical protein
VGIFAEGEGAIFIFDYFPTIPHQPRYESLLQ